MRTRNYFRYLLAALALSGNVSLGMAQSSAPTWSWTRGTTQGTDVWYKNNSTNLESVRIGDMTDPEYWNNGIGFGLTTPQSGELTRINSKTKSNIYRAAVEELKLSVVVPSYTEATYSAEFATYSLATDGNYTKHGCSLFNWGRGDNNKTIAENRTFSTLERNQESTLYFVCGNYQRNNGESQSNYTTKTIIFNNSTNGSEQNVDAYFAVLAYIRNSGGSPDKNVEFAVKYRNESVSYKYHATINFDKNGGTGTYVSSMSGRATGQDGYFTLPTTGTITKSGYKFLGWMDEETGTVYQNGDKFYPYDATSGGGRGNVTLKAVWGNNGSYLVTLNAQGGTGGSTTVIATLGEKLSSGLTAPVKLGYEFKGFYSSQNQEYAESMGQDYGGTQYYDKDMVGVNNWNLNYNATIYAHWKPIKYVLKLDAGSKSVIPTTSIGNGNHGFTVSEDRTTITMNVSVGENLGHFYNGEPKKPGFKFKGFYVGDKLVAKANGRDIVFTNEGGYVNNSTWQYAGNLTLTAAWEPKYTFKDGIIDFGTETLEVGIDWQKGEVNDLLGAAEAESESGNVSKENPVMVFDIRKADYLDYSSKNGAPLMEALKNKEFISPNVLVYLGNGAYNVVDNEVTIDNKCTSLVVNDRLPMKIPYGFTAQKATYERNKAQKGDMDDVMWKQSYESVWGTLCLPYPIKNDNTHRVSADQNAEIDCQIKFYELRGTHDNYMQFYEMEPDKVIAANTPVLYCRTAGIGSNVSIVENSVAIPANADYQTTVVDYSNKTQVPLAEESVMYWKFVGTLVEKTFIGSEYRKPENYGPTASPGAIEVTDRDIYYFASNNFTHMNSKKGKVVVLPYRAYFEDYTDFFANSKVSSYSILVVDADGTTTDITNFIDNHEAKGNGKIYDLSGRRVKQPVKGSIYIVDGKKKIY